MKYCDNCHKNIDTDGSFCPTCGSRLYVIEQKDIFGDPFTPNENKAIDNNGGVTIEGLSKINTLDFFSELLPLLSLGLSLIPILGIMISLLSLALNIVNIYKEKKKIGFLILSAIIFIFSIFWTILLFKNNIFSLTS